MRTTLTMDDDVLDAVKEIATRERTTAGKVISVLVRHALRCEAVICNKRDGVPLLPVSAGSTLVTPELVNQLRDELT